MGGSWSVVCLSGFGLAAAGYLGFMAGRLVSQRRYMGEILELRQAACRRRLLSRLGALE